MSIDWTHQKRIIFKSALQRVYPDYEELELFVDDGIDENLANIADVKRLPLVIGDLVRWAKTNNKLNELFEAFRKKIFMIL
ncbi:MAG: effector-associated domain EAD1-containing protein [Phormidesmis sp.]